MLYGDLIRFCHNIDTASVLNEDVAGGIVGHDWIPVNEYKHWRILEIIGREIVSYILQTYLHAIQNICGIVHRDDLSHRLRELTHPPSLNTPLLSKRLSLDPSDYNPLPKLLQSDRRIRQRPIHSIRILPSRPQHFSSCRGTRPQHSLDVLWVGLL